MRPDTRDIARPVEELAGLPDRLDLSKTPGVTIGELSTLVFREAAIRVLVVIDTEIRFGEVPIRDRFGVGRFIRVVRETTVGCTGFVVDVAVRSPAAFVDHGNVPAGQPRYQGFRFNSLSDSGQLVLERYDEVFLFGFKPDNLDGPDSNIDLPTSLPASDPELLQLTAWMDKGGGVFATGDHDYLGASMCHRIPRVGTMRKWTNAQRVPPIGGPRRLDTNQPATARQRAGIDRIAVQVEEDATPQPLEWVAERTYYSGLFRHRLPHEVLCHPTHGPIDVMPDHPHEGCCIEPAAIDATRRLNFDPRNPKSAFDEYPTEAGHQELPRIIAYGRVVPDPPFEHEKGDVFPFTIPMISVYDGWAVKRGRIVCDSTWHHWFNMNLGGLESAPDQTNWEKISRYFVNVAKWIAPADRYQARCWWEILLSHYNYPGIEEFTVGDRFQVGRALRDTLASVHGPCTVTDMVIRTICDIHPALCAFVDESVIAKVKPEPCLTCPPFEVLERVVLAGFVEGTGEVAAKLKDAIDAGQTEGFQLEVAEVEQAAMAGAARALTEFAQEVTASAERTLAAFGAVGVDRATAG